jgi:hypothetical protein
MLLLFWKHNGIGQLSSDLGNLSCGVFITLYVRVWRLCCCTSGAPFVFADQLSRPDINYRRNNHRKTATQSTHNLSTKVAILWDQEENAVAGNCAQLTEGYLGTESRTHELNSYPGIIYSLTNQLLLRIHLSTRREHRRSRS